MKKRSGFTLIELLVVVVILGILISIGMRQYGDALDRSRCTGMGSLLRATQLGMEQWKTDFDGLPVELVGDTPNVALAANDPAKVPNWGQGYTPGGLLAITPWATTPQVTMEDGYDNVSYPPAADALLIGDTDVASFMANGPANDQPPLGGGTYPVAGVGPAQRSDYGYLYYVGDKDSGTYYLFGTGKVGTDCLVVACRSND